MKHYKQQGVLKMLDATIEAFQLAGFVEAFSSILIFCKWYFIVLVIVVSLITGIVVFVTSYKELKTTLKKRWVAVLLSFVLGVFSCVFVGPILLITALLGTCDF